MHCYQTKVTILRTLDLKSVLLVVLGGLCLPLSLLADETASYPVAGMAPDQRPRDAPVITEATRNDDWYQTALHGVEPPYPSSLKFLEDQGNWYTPFTRSGMEGRYDIRGWHTE